MPFRPISTTTPPRARTVTLDDKTVELLRGLSGGNLSEGIRMAAHMLFPDDSPYVWPRADDDWMPDEGLTLDDVL